jgi:outer membrane protein TolC
MTESEEVEATSTHAPHALLPPRRSSSRGLTENDSPEANPEVIQTAAEEATVDSEQEPAPPPSPLDTLTHASPGGAIELDLCRSLRIAGSANPTIALAYEGIRAAESERLAADVLALPTVRAGIDYHSHSGNVLSAGGTIQNLDRQSTYRGLGASAVGSGTVTVPGVRVLAHVADAWYEPQVAEQRITQTRFDASAMSNAVLLDVAVRYFDVLGAQAHLDALLQTRKELQDLAKQTQDFLKTGQGRQADADRAASELRLIEVQIGAAEERIDVAVAEWARLLHLSPGCDLRTVGPLEELHLSCLDAPPDELVRQAVASRPEIGARSAAIGAASSKHREEVVRPFVPILSAGYSTGTFAGGNDYSDRRFGGSDGREDFDAFAVWSLDGLGFGNCAIQRKRQAEVCMARARRIGTIDRVRREVAEAHAGVAARRLELEAARRALRSSVEGYRLDAERSRNLEGLPIELLNSINLLSDSRLDEVRALTAYNQEQFRLLVAIGQSPLCQIPAICDQSSTSATASNDSELSPQNRAGRLSMRVEPEISVHP